jgi:streptogramin lyase
MSARGAEPGVAATGAPRIVTIAGTGRAGYSGDGGPAVQARIQDPYGLCKGPDGALYFCDRGNHVIRRVTAAGLIETVAGTGERGYSGDGGPARRARLSEPYEVRFDADGNLVFVEMSNHLIRRVDRRSRLISTLAGSGTAGYGGDGGLAREAVFRQPHSIQFDRAGALYICDIGNHRVRRVDPRTGRIATFAGTGAKERAADGAAWAAAPLLGPRALDFDARGALWLALREGNAILRLDLETGVLVSMAGTGESGFTGNGGLATQARLSGPKGISAAPGGDIYFADTESHTLRRLDVRKRTVELVAGTGARGDGPDGDPLKCQLARPHGVFVDADGAVYVGDSENHRVRKLTW